MGHGVALIVLAVAAVGTYSFRGSVIILLGDRPIPPVVERALQNVGPAVLAALTVSLAVSSTGGQVDLDIVELSALALAGAVAVWRKNLLWTLAAGMGAILVLGAF